MSMEMTPIKHTKIHERPLGRGAQDHPNTEGPTIVYGAQLPPMSQAGYLVLSTNCPMPADLSQCLHRVLVGRHMGTKEPQSGTHGRSGELTGAASTFSHIRACAVGGLSSLQAWDFSRFTGLRSQASRIFHLGLS